MTTILFGGTACPLGLNVQFLQAPEAEVIASFLDGLNTTSSTATGSSFPDAVGQLLPFQAPWTRMLTASVGDWTALANNFIGGGDSSAPSPAIARRLGVPCVVATHAPRYGPGHAQTQLEVYGPSGKPPLMYVRAISASATDGRWAWYESGEPLPFEQTSRYTERLKRNRFDRPMLLDYLSALGIPVDDSDYGQATVHQRAMARPSREASLDEARADYAT